LIFKTKLDALKNVPFAERKKNAFVAFRLGDFLTRSIVALLTMKCFKTNWNFLHFHLALHLVQLSKCFESYFDIQ
jgi:branched-subunit amino acid transport protein AzlD